jgi:hypothetical protein
MKGMSLRIRKVLGYALTDVAPAARYIYSVPEGRGFGRWTWYDFLALSLMIRGVLSPGSETRVDC